MKKCLSKVSDDVAAKFMEIPLGNICDANGRTGAMDFGIRPIDPGCRMAGYAYTVKGHPGDNVAIHKAMLQAPENSVLVVDMKGYCKGGHFGEIMATACKVQGIVGLVIDGSVRDAEEIQELGFPVFCRGICPNGTTKFDIGETGVPIMCGGICVETGDLVVGGRDGVVVIQKKKIESVLAAAESIVKKEEKIIPEIESGKTTQEIYKFQAIEDAEGG